MRAFTGSRGIVVPAAIGPSAVPNVWLIASIGGDAGGFWRPGRYQLEVERAGRTALLQVCLSMRSPDATPFAIPGGSISDDAFRTMLDVPGARLWPLLRPGFSPAILGS